jgi:phosphate-selective porin OprO/OprP
MVLLKRRSGGIAGILPVLLILLLPPPASAMEAGKEKPPVGIYGDRDTDRQVVDHRWFDLRVGGRLHYDFGRIDADEELQEAFPGLDGFHGGIRRLRLAVLANVRDIVEIKIEVDFARVEDVKDDWIRFPSVPVLKNFAFGHFMEPFSLGMLTGSNYITFMERPLAVDAFGPFRNLGVLGAWTGASERLSAAAGVFRNTGSYGSDGQAKDRIENANGYNATARVTGLPWYGDKGRKLLHLGLSGSRRFRDEDKEDASGELKAPPESRLTDDRLVNTGRLAGERQDLAALEAAVVRGPLSLQGELFFHFIDRSADSDLSFSGWYVSAGWIVTGEHRRYDRASGVFAGVKPHRIFDPRRGGWGALELAARYSTVDLNDGNVRGGEERNATVGLNWYLRPKVRAMANYVQARVQDRAAPEIDDGRADIVMARFQVSF